MPNLLSLLFRCTRCAATWGDTVARDEKDRKDFPCPACGEAAGVRTFAPPNVTKASFVDGHKRRGFTDLKEAARLEARLSDLPSEEKVRVQAEVRQIRERAKGE